MTRCYFLSNRASRTVFQIPVIVGQRVQQAIDQTHNMARDPIAGPDSGPEPPFPIKINGRIVKGFGRGSKEVRSKR